MDQGEQSHLRKLIEERKKRLRVLEVQEAQFGVNCPAEVLVEIKDIKASVLKLERQLREPDDNHHDTTLSQRFAPVAEPVPPCPYPGMVPFRTDEARFFYGRDAEIKQMLQHLRHQRLLFVIGPSGYGKSSLILAGLLPKLRTSSYFPPDYWLERVMRPGAQPLQALAHILDSGEWEQSVQNLLAAHPPAQRLLLIVDQFEEIFAQASREEQNNFAAAIQALYALKNCVIVVVVRADFYADLMTSDLWPLVPNRRLEIATPRGKELRRAIEQPAADQGIALEERLVERLLADAADEPGALPLMQETLVVLWGMMEPRPLTLRTYEELGGAGRSGLAVAVANKADAALAQGRAGDLNANQQMLLEIAHTNMLQVLEMVNRLLDISRLEAGRMPLELQVCAVRTLVERAIERLIALAQERQISINVDVAPDLALVSADRGLIIRVLQNLLDNAIKYSGRGTAIHFNAFEGVNEAHASQHFGAVTIAVRDQGIGIAPEDHEKIFVKFGQAGERRGGTGLGLTFCKLAVEAHGGRIWVESALGAGSTFFFTLPLHLGHAGSTQEPRDGRD